MRNDQRFSRIKDQAVEGERGREREGEKRQDVSSSSLSMSSDEMDSSRVVSKELSADSLDSKEMSERESLELSEEGTSLIKWKNDSMERKMMGVWRGSLTGKNKGSALAA